VRCTASLVLVALAACGPKAGKDCKENGATTCADAKTSLVCENGKWQPFPCRGQGGCKVSGVSAKCDVTGGVAGDLCPARDENRKTCTPDGKAMLTCEKGKVSSTKCSGPNECRTDPMGTHCDEGLPIAGDTCEAHGKYGCGRYQALLLCKTMKWTAVRPCRGGCADSFEHATCDIRGALPDESCDEWESGMGNCSPDGKQVLICRNARWSVATACDGEKKCGGATGETDRPGVTFKRFFAPECR
jgi:hypothetical protein